LSKAPNLEFYGFVSLVPVEAQMESATIIDEAVQQFTAKLVVNAKMSVEIKPTILFLKYSEYSGRA
jgi:hypothetical protein